MSTSFFDLPSVVCIDLFTMWIDSRDLANLDSAVTNRQQRKLFLEMFEDPFFILRGSENLVMPSYLNWLSLRSLKVDKVVLTSSFLKDSEQMSRMNVSKLESLTFNNGKSYPSKNTELTLFQKLLSFAIKPDDPYQKLFVRCGALKHVDFGDEADSSFGKIGMFCAKLQSIKAVHCKGLSDTAVENIAQHCRTNIHTVVLRACDQLTSASVLALADNCPNLTHVDISYGSTLSERCLIQLAEKCPLLEFVNFEGLRNISDKVIATVAANCRNLTYFNIDYYKGMSHEGIDPVALKLIAQSCTKIIDFIAPEFHYKVRNDKASLQLKGVYTRLPKLLNILHHSPEKIYTLQAAGESCVLYNEGVVLVSGSSLYRESP